MKFISVAPNLQEGREKMRVFVLRPGHCLQFVTRTGEKCQSGPTILLSFIDNLDQIAMDPERLVGVPFGAEDDNLESGWLLYDRPVNHTQMVALSLPYREEIAETIARNRGFRCHLAAGDEVEFDPVTGTLIARPVLYRDITFTPKPIFDPDNADQVGYIDPPESVWAPASERDERLSGAIELYMDRSNVIHSLRILDSVIFRNPDPTPDSAAEVPVPAGALPLSTVPAV